MFKVPVIAGLFAAAKKISRPAECEEEKTSAPLSRRRRARVNSIVADVYSHQRPAACTPVYCEEISLPAVARSHRADRDRISGNYEFKKGMVKLQNLQNAEQTKLLQVYRKFHGEKHCELGFQEMQKIFGEIGITDEFVAWSLFAVMDTDMSGTIDFKEFMAFCTLLAQGSEADKAGFVFEACDLDASGTVDRDEMKVMVIQMMVARAAMTSDSIVTPAEQEIYDGIPEDFIYQLKANQLVHDIFKAADLDRNNSIDLKEFMFWFKRGGKQVNEFKLLFATFDAYHEIL